MKKRKKILYFALALALLLYLMSPFFAVARLQISSALQGGPSPIGKILYYRQVDSAFAVEVVGEKLYLGEGRCNAYPYFLVWNGPFWRAVQMNENTRLLFQTTERDRFYIFDSFAEKLGAYTVLCVGSSYIQKQGLSAEEIYDSEGTTPLLLSHEQLKKDVDWGHWGASCADEPGLTSRYKDLSGYGMLFVLRDMPENYELHCGETVLTAKDIEALFA